jgi:hypothetical protein
MNLITRKHLSRRTVLRGAGVTVALPFLDAMIPASTALAQTAAAPKPRLGFIYFPHGAIMEKWLPATTGADFELTPILEPLAAHKATMTVVSGLRNKPGESAAVHAIMPGTWLSCVHPAVSHSPDMAPTADQIAAAQISGDTPFPSIEVATEPGGNGGACDRNYGCSYAGTISFRTATQPNPMEYNPRKIFYRLFGVGDTPEERAKIAGQYTSLLDLVTEEATGMQRSLGVADRVMLDNYLQSVREIEAQIQKMEAMDLTAMELPEVPQGVLQDFDQQLNLMFDILALSYQADLTRVVNMMMASEASGRTYNHVGVADAFHPLSHHQNNQAKKDKLVIIQRYHSEIFAKFLDKLAAMPDGENTVLQNSLILYGSNMSNSNAHNNDPLPSALFGGACGRVKGNQHLAFPQNTPHANLIHTILDRAGVHLDSFGDSTGVISEI